MRVYYRLEYSGIEKIPFGKPVVLAPNHVNAFIDPVVVAMLPKHKVRFFARGDVFNKKLAAFFLEQLNISPMWRIQEGYSEVKKNDKTFEECRRLLSSNQTILLFPEGICVQEKRLRPLKKGLARIVFQTAQTLNYDKDIYIIPVGLNYEDANKFRSKLFIDFGEPVTVADYVEQYKVDPVRAINSFTKHLEARMKQYLIIINNPDNDVFSDNLCEMFVKEEIKAKDKDNKKIIHQYTTSAKIVEMINYFAEKNHLALENIKQKVAEYFKLLSQYQLRDHLLHTDSINASNTGTFIIEFFKLYLGFPIYVLGLIFNFPPYFLSKIISNNKVKEIEFYASVYANLAMIFWLIYYPLQLLIVALVFKSWLLVAIHAIVVPVTGYYVLGFYPMMKKVRGRWRLLRMVRKNKQEVEKLIGQRNEIVHLFEAMKKEYSKI